MTDDLDLARLRMFREVAVRGSFSAAATALRLTQPAVSQQIAKLERELGAMLLDRSTRRITTTPPGRALLAHVDAVLERLAEARREVMALAHPDGGDVSLIAFASAAVTVVGALVAAWTEAHPSCRVRVSHADPPEGLPQVLRGDANLALAYAYPILGSTAHDPRLRITTLVHDPMAVALPTTHPLATEPVVALTALAHQHWVTPSDRTGRDALQAACGTAGFRPRIRAETDDYLTMLGLVQAEVGIGVVPRLLIAGSGRLPPGLVLRPMVGSPLVRTVFMASRVAGYLPPGVDRMLSIARDLLPTLSHPDLPLRPDPERRDVPPRASARAPQGRVGPWVSPSVLPRGSRC